MSQAPANLAPGVGPVELQFVTAAPTGPRLGEPVRCGLPWPRGALIDPDQLRLRDGQGQAALVQHSVLERWPDGSVRWLLLDFLAHVRGFTTYTLHVGGPPIEPEGPRASVRETREGIFIETGVATFHIGSRLPFESVRVGDDEMIDVLRAGFRCEDGARHTFRPEVASSVIEASGPVRVVVCTSGTMVSPRGTEPIADFQLRMHFFAGSPTVRMEWTLTNPRRAEHHHGLWDLGDPGSVYLRDMSLVLNLPTSFDESRGRVSAEINQPCDVLPLPIELYQDSSGGEQWNSRNHLTRDRKIPTTLRGYRLRAGRLKERTGFRATPIVEVARGTRTLVVAMSEFWQNFPKALEASDDSITLRLFPRQFSDLHELQAGERKMHAFHVAFGRDRVTLDPLSWVRVPLCVQAKPEWYCASGVFPHLVPQKSDPHRDYLDLVSAGIDGEATFDRKREVIDEFGWRHFGDIYGDHEAVFHQGPTPLISHYNNQYDAVGGFALQYLRGGDLRWLRHCDELARHVRDIDLYHTHRDKSAYNGGLFWHTFHYIDADTSTHRTYPLASVRKVRGGGPADEQNYNAGLALHYYLTGDADSKTAAIQLAEWVIAMDDGRKTPLRWLCTSPTGLASKSRTEAYHGPGRGSANSVDALLVGHRLTGERRFLTKAEELIHRVIHPNDDVPARNLLDAENRWFYTMFLQALGRYLHYKIELDELDEHYAYGRASLLHYARWMAEHEYPYLNKPERLEYPTETWAAQDLRKCEVFQVAALHASGAERQRFIERADYFFRYSIGKLREMPTRTLARPLVLLLSHGTSRAWFVANADAQAPEPRDAVTDFGMPTRFVSQKQIAKKRLAILLAVLVAAACGVGAAWYFGLVP